MNPAVLFGACVFFAVAGVVALVFAVGYVFRGIGPAKKHNVEMVRDALYLGLPVPKDNTGLRIGFGCIMTVSALAMFVMSAVLYHNM